MITKIKTIDDVKSFMNQLIQVEKLSFHPDDDINDYVTCKNQPFYSKKEAELRNKLMNDCFKVCENSNEEIYEIVFSMMVKELNLKYE